MTCPNGPEQGPSDPLNAPREQCSCIRLMAVNWAQKSYFCRPKYPYLGMSQLPTAGTWCGERSRRSSMAFIQKSRRSCTIVRIITAAWCTNTSDGGSLDLPSRACQGLGAKSKDVDSTYARRRERSSKKSKPRRRRQVFSRRKEQKAGGRLRGKVRERQDRCGTAPDWALCSVISKRVCSTHSGVRDAYIHMYLFGKNVGRVSRARRLGVAASRLGRHALRLLAGRMGKAQGRPPRRHLRESQQFFGYGSVPHTATAMPHTVGDVQIAPCREFGGCLGSAPYTKLPAPIIGDDHGAHSGFGISLPSTLPLTIFESAAIVL
ncbi:hypothetical protein B0T17DRAFT_595079 [Bombardia bombarda]|uniref:Uncharacterized protein n=1 Tax=Bombardia bombarda TaxID=252184 RepID=A0AA40CFG6_9PEZI|nr:hypothetical protein B0T17DRAFT_595079 [Bombardia bombarda]